MGHFKESSCATGMKLHLVQFLMATALIKVADTRSVDLDVEVKVKTNHQPVSVHNQKSTEPAMTNQTISSRSSSKEQCWPAGTNCHGWVFFGSGYKCCSRLCFFFCA